MLTEEMLFPNLGRSNPSQVRRLTMQERARLVTCPFFLTADDLLKARNGKPARHEPDEVQIVCTTIT
jgi:hypothetical protein